METIRPRRRRRLLVAALAAALVPTLASVGEAYSHIRNYINGQYYLSPRETTTMTFRINMTSLSPWVATLGGTIDSRVARSERVRQDVINAFEAWEQVPWATVVCNYDGASAVTGPTQNNVNDVFFANQTSWAWWWNRTSGTTIGTIYEGDNRLNYGVINAGRLGAEAVQESGHIIGLDHSQVSNSFTATTDNASVSVGVNMNNDNVLSQDDITGVSILYPVMRRTWTGRYWLIRRAYVADFGTVRGTVRTVLGTSIWNGAGVLAVNLSTGGAVVGTFSGTYAVPTSGLTGDLGTDGNGQYELPCLPAGTYAIVACPLTNYFASTVRMQANGFDAADLNAVNPSGARTVTVAAGSARTGIDFDGNHGDVNNDLRWTAADLTTFDAFVANPASYGWFRAFVNNVCDLNNDGVSNATDRAMLVQLINMSNSAAVAGSVF